MLAYRVSLCASQFRNKPSSEFQGHLLNFLDRTLTFVEAATLLEYLPKNFSTFPSLLEIEKLSSQFKVRPEPRHFSARWVSRVAPGTPAVWEALFLLIKSCFDDSAPQVYSDKKEDFRMLNKRYKIMCISEEKAFEYYEKWCAGEVHDDIKTGRVKWNRSFSTEAVRSNLSSCFKSF